jgi:hypothetical protein
MRCVLLAFDIATDAISPDRHDGGDASNVVRFSCGMVAVVEGEFARARVCV